MPWGQPRCPLPWVHLALTLTRSIHGRKSILTMMWSSRSPTTLGVNGSPSRREWHPHNIARMSGSILSHARRRPWNLILTLTLTKLVGVGLGWGEPLYTRFVYIYKVCTYIQGLYIYIHTRCVYLQGLYIYRSYMCVYAPFLRKTMMCSPTFIYKVIQGLYIQGLYIYRSYIYIGVYTPLYHRGKL